MQTEEYARMRQFEDEYWWFVSRRRLALSLLQEFEPVGKVLDVGCGTGAVLAEIQKNRDAWGLDFSELALDFGRERGLLNLVHGNAESLPFADGEFSAIVTLDTLEHVPDDVKAIAEIARVLEPGGAAIINVPAFRWLWGPHDVALMHFRRYTKNELADKLTAAGLEVQWASYGVFFLFPVVVMIRVLDKLKKRDAEVDLPKVSPGFNRFLLKLMDFEARLMRNIPLPWGSSVAAVAVKPLSKP